MSDYKENYYHYWINEEKYIGMRSQVNSTRQKAKLTLSDRVKINSTEQEFKLAPLGRVQINSTTITLSKWSVFSTM